MIKYWTYKSGDLHGLVYFFGDAGDTVPTHNHKVKEDPHNIVVLQGAVELRRDKENIILEAGDIFDFDGNDDHSIVAVEARSKIVNFYIYGRPKAFIDGFVGEVHAPNPS